jgi:hypothetical protein
MSAEHSINDCNSYRIDNDSVYRAQIATCFTRNSEFIMNNLLIHAGKQKTIP